MTENSHTQNYPHCITIKSNIYCSSIILFVPHSHINNRKKGIFYFWRITKKLTKFNSVKIIIYRHPFYLGCSYLILSRVFFQRYSTIEYQFCICCFRIDGKETNAFKLEFIVNFCAS